jgi:transposase
MMRRRYELADREWEILSPLLPNKPRGVPRVDDRRVLNGILWRFRTGSPWAEIPERYGPSTTCYNRTSKLHALVDAEGRPITLRLTAGLGEGDILLADKGDDSNAIRAKAAKRQPGDRIRPSKAPLKGSPFDNAIKAGDKGLVRFQTHQPCCFAPVHG